HVGRVLLEVLAQQQLRLRYLVLTEREGGGPQPGRPVRCLDVPRVSAVCALSVPQDGQVARNLAPGIGQIRFELYRTLQCEERGIRAANLAQRHSPFIVRCCPVRLRGDEALQGRQCQLELPRDTRRHTQ